MIGFLKWTVRLLCTPSFKLKKRFLEWPSIVGRGSDAVQQRAEALSDVRRAQRIANEKCHPQSWALRWIFHPIQHAPGCKPE